MVPAAGREPRRSAPRLHPAPTAAESPTPRGPWSPTRAWPWLRPPSLSLPRSPSSRSCPPPPEDDLGLADLDAEAPPFAGDEGPLTPPALVAGATAAARFHALRAWLEQGGLEGDLWAHDAVLLGEQPPELRIGFRSEFNVRQARRKLADRRLRLGMEVYFPRCSVITVELAEELGQSRREADQAAYEQRVVALTDELRQHPLTLRLQALLGAQLLEVYPDAAIRADAPEGAELLLGLPGVDGSAPVDDDEDLAP
ncbi:hypothetical protein L6R53_02615 [Myxococcota bacterium]|nr:hypothetical protein [Myxococcota bacterium]